MNQERAKKPFQVVLDGSLRLAPDLFRQKIVVVFNLKFSMVNSNSKLNECESEPAPANLNLISVS